MLAMHPDKDRDGHGGAHGVNEPARGEETKPVSEVIDRFDEELADVAVLYVPGNLPVVLAKSGERIDDRQDEIVGNHLAERVAAYRAGLGSIDRTPEGNNGKERHEAENHPEQKIHPINEGVLNANVNDVPVLGHAR